MAKKRRHRIWWFALFPDQYKKLTEERVLPVPMVLFDKSEMAYSMGYADRFEPLMDADGNRVVVSDYVQLKDNGKITVVGIHGSVINWKKNVTVERAPHGNMESIYLEQPIKLDAKAVYRILEETDEMYANHLQSPLARAGGLTVPEDVQQRIHAKQIVAEGQRQIAEQMEREANTDGEDVGPAVDATSAEVGNAPA